MHVTPKKIVVILATVWIVFTLVYVPWDLWNHFKTEQLNQAYNLGKADTINDAMRRADKCEPFSIFSNDKEAQVINMKCLSQQKNASGSGIGEKE